MSDWTVRRAVREDEPCIIQMWMHQLLRYSFSRPDEARPTPGSDAHIAFWRLAQPVVEGLLRCPSVTTLVACDPERSEYRAGHPAVVCGWSICDDERIYGVGLKRKYLPSPELPVSENELLRGIGTDLATAVLANELGKPRRTVMALYDLHRLSMPTPTWTRDDAWLAIMADVSRLLTDATSASVGRHILDPAREAWVTNEQRAA